MTDADGTAGTNEASSPATNEASSPATNSTAETAVKAAKRGGQPRSAVAIGGTHKTVRPVAPGNAVHGAEPEKTPVQEAIAQGDAKKESDALSDSDTDDERARTDAAKIDLAKKRLAKARSRLKAGGDEGRATKRSRGTVPPRPARGRGRKRDRGDEEGDDNGPAQARVRAEDSSDDEGEISSDIADIGGMERGGLTFDAAWEHLRDVELLVPQGNEQRELVTTGSKGVSRAFGPKSSRKTPGQFDRSGPYTTSDGKPFTRKRLKTLPPNGKVRLTDAKGVSVVLYYAPRGSSTKKRKRRQRLQEQVARMMRETRPGLGALKK